MTEPNDDLKPLQKQAEALALSFSDPAALARNLAEWAKQNLPERVSSALWITAKGDKDKGIDFEIRTFKLGHPKVPVRLGALLGATSGGLAVTAPITDRKAPVKIAVGVGATVLYANLRRVDPVLVFRVSF